MLRTIMLGVLAAGLAFAITFAIGRAGIQIAQVPRAFPPFTALPILSGAVGGPVLAFIAFALIQALTRQPEKPFLFTAIIALALSFALPIRLSFTKSSRFAGVTPTAQMILVLMHTVVATISVGAVLQDNKGH